MKKLSKEYENFTNLMDRLLVSRGRGVEVSEPRHHRLGLARLAPQTGHGGHIG